MPHLKAYAAVFAIFVVTLTIGTAHANDFDIQPTSDARADTLAVSGTGNASSSWGTSVSVAGDASNDRCSRGTADIGCVAVSGLGKAINSDCAITTRINCVAFSATGSATNSYQCASTRLACVAVAGEDATNSGDSCHQKGCIAVSLTGNATNGAAPDSCYETIGCLAVAPLGHASNECREFRPVECIAFDRDTWQGLLP